MKEEALVPHSPQWEEAMAWAVTELASKQCPENGQCRHCSGQLVIKEVVVSNGRAFAWGPAVCEQCGARYPFVSEESRRVLGAEAVQAALTQYHEAMRRPTGQLERI